MTISTEQQINIQLTSTDLRKITSINDEQWQRVSVFREECRAKALRPHHATDRQLRDAVKAIYRTSFGTSFGIHMMRCGSLAGRNITGFRFTIFALR